MMREAKAIYVCKSCDMAVSLLRTDPRLCPHCKGPLIGSKGKSKYGNSKIIVNGVKFDSKKEARRHGVLVQLEAMGAIKDLELQPRFKLEVNGVKLGAYIGDFGYVDVATGERVIEDAKGMRTRLYVLKRKLMLAIHNITIREV